MATTSTERSQKRQAYLREQGLCMVCGKNRPEPSSAIKGRLSVRCQPCADRRNAIRRGDAPPPRPPKAAFVRSQLAPDKPYRSETIVGKRPIKAPSESWWVGHTTRESFNARLEKETERLLSSGGVQDVDRVSYAPSVRDDRRWSKKRGVFIPVDAEIRPFMEAR